MHHFLEETFRLFGDVVERVVEDFTSQQTKVHDAHFIKERELLSSAHSGFCLNGARNLSNKLSFQNALVVGSTGTGKTANILIPSLFAMKNASYLVNDPSGELHAKASGYLASCGFDVKVLNFANPELSCGYNPLLRANTSQEIQKVAAMLVDSGLGGGKATDKFWDSMGVNLIAMLIGILKTQPEQYQTLFNVRQLLNAVNSNPKGLYKLFADNADDLLFAEFDSFNALDDKLKSSTLATCKAALQIFTDGNVARITSFDSIDMLDFRKKPTALFVQTSIGDAKYLASLVSLFHQQCINHILSRFPEKDERDIFYLLDEASSLKIPILPLATANVRKHFCGILLVVQSEQQLVNNYGKADADSIMANCFSKIYLAGQDLDTCKKLESILGKREVKDKEGKKEILPLMDSTAIRTMKLNQGILLAGYHKPILMKLYPYYENPRYRKYAAMPTPAPQHQAPFASIPTIELEPPDDDED